MRSDETISVIIPVYKVEKYLNRCIESVVKQTYVNLEILLVDDGSPDMCPKICDDWEKKDKRIHVIHKKNGGLSDARNVGIEYSTGDYICFVDSDDYIADRFIETLYNIICENSVLVSAVGIEKVYENKNNKKEKSGLKSITVYKNGDALRELFSDDTYANYAWNKMYKRELFTTIQFPKNRKMEDLGTIYKVLMKTNEIVYSAEPLYYYYQRSGSILHNKDKKFYIDVFELSYERYKDIKKAYPEMLENKIYFFEIVLECYAVVYKKYSWKDWKKIITELYISVRKYINWKLKIKYLLFVIFNPIYLFWNRKN